MTSSLNFELGETLDITLAADGAVTVTPPTVEYPTRP